MKAWEFFYRQAGWSYDPRTQSPIVGRLLGADALARAEEWARSMRASFEWSDDPEQADCQDESGSWRTYPAVGCVLQIELPFDGDLVESLCGIIESSDYRTAQDYRRVVEAELALEAMARALP